MVTIFTNQNVEVSPPPGSCGIRELRVNPFKIFGLKALIGKIFQTKDFSSADSVRREHAERVRFAY
jgi:hypothetical protein